MLLRVKGLAICDIYIYKDVFGISLGKRIFSNVYEMKGTQTLSSHWYFNFAASI